MINFEEKFLKNHLRHCILFSYVDGITAPMACDRKNEVYEANTITRCTVYKWYRRFKEGDLSPEEEKRVARPVELSRIELNEYLKDNSKPSTRELGMHFEVDYTTISRALEQLKKTRKYGLWVPKELAETDKIKRVSAARSLLQKYYDLLEVMIHF